MYTKKLIAWVLLLAMVVSFAACGSQDDGGKTAETTAPSVDAVDTTAAGDNAETTAPVDARELVSDGLPDQKFDTTFTIMDRTKYVYEFEAEKITGELINDMIYKRNNIVSERFGVEFQYVTLDCDWGGQATEFNNKLLASVMTNDGAYDLVAGYAATIPALVSQGIFHNWADMAHNDFSKPWWSKEVAEELTINGKSFMVTGDLSLALWKGMNCLFFNKELAKNYGIEDMYGMVERGEWTFDRLIALTTDVYADLDNNQTANDADLYGLLCGRSTEIDSLKEAFEIKVTEKGEDGFPKFTFSNERTFDIVKRLNAYIHESGNVFLTADGNAEARAKQATAFSEGKGIFFTSTLGVSETLRSMEGDFGIIPYPKYDDKQKSYHSTSLDEFSLFLVPTDAKNPEMSSIITEALCAESYKKVIPAFYDVALKTRDSRDEDSAKMIDMIRDGLIFDWGYIHSNALGGVGHLFVIHVRDNNNSIATAYDSSAKIYGVYLKRVLEVYQ